MQLQHPLRFWRRVIRRLIPLLGLMALVGVLFSGTPVVSQSVPREIRGVWMTINDKDVLSDRPKLQAAVGQLGQLGFNTIYPVVWNSGYAMYPSNLTQTMGIQSFTYRGVEGQDMLTDLITQAHQAGLAVMPWFEFGFMTPPTSELALQYANWLTARQDGSQTSTSDAGEVAWLNPFHPQVQDFIINLVLEVVSQYDVDGIQFDDHTSLPRDFGYDNYTVNLYQKETKKPVPTNPQDPAWMRWRANKITAFMAKLRTAVRQQKPNVVISLSPNYYDFAYKLHLQDWLAWVQQGIVDELIVQVYRQDQNSFLEQINRPEIQTAQAKIPTGIGILTGLRNRPVAMSQIQVQVQAVQQRGLGVSFFYFESLWDRAPEPLLERLSGFRQLFMTTAIKHLAATVAPTLPKLMLSQAPGGAALRGEV